MGGFNHRRERAAQFETYIFDAIKSMRCFSVAMNGTEHTHAEFVETLHASTDKTSLMIRFQPDGVIKAGNVPRCAFVEAKLSEFIEKDAYTIYKEISDSGAIVYIVFGEEQPENSAKKYHVKFSRIENLEFEDTQKYNSKTKWPVIDGWVTPRADEDYATKKLSFRGSGTPYKLVKTRDMPTLEQFKTRVIADLSNAKTREQ